MAHSGEAQVGTAVDRQPCFAPSTTTPFIPSNLAATTLTPAAASPPYVLYDYSVQDRELAALHAAKNSQTKTLPDVGLIFLSTRRRTGHPRGPKRACTATAWGYTSFGCRTTALSAVGSEWIVFFL